eukprot:5263671-Pleurochrysis_carterae.AAC.1
MAGARDSWIFPANNCAAFMCHSQQVLTITAPQVLVEGQLEEPHGSSADAPSARTWQHATLLIVLLAGDRLVRVLLNIAPICQPV